MLDLRGASYMHNTRPEHVTVFITLLSSRVPSFFYFDLSFGFLMTFGDFCLKIGEF